VNREQAGDNQVVACLLHCTLCCCSCFKGFVEFISKNAYIDIAISSSSFCASVKNVAKVMIDHGAAMAILNSATFIFQVVGMVTMTAFSGFIAYITLELHTFSNPESSLFVANKILATFLACLLALVVSWAFMTVFDMATDTLLICISMDISRNGRDGCVADPRLQSLFEQAEQAAAKRKKDEERKAMKASKTPKA